MAVIPLRASLSRSVVRVVVVVVWIVVTVPDGFVGIVRVIGHHPLITRARVPTDHGVGCRCSSVHRRHVLRSATQQIIHAPVIRPSRPRAQRTCLLRASRRSRSCVQLRENRRNATTNTQEQQNDTSAGPALHNTCRTSGVYARKRACHSGKLSAR